MLFDYAQKTLLKFYTKKISYGIIFLAKILDKKDRNDGGKSIGKGSYFSNKSRI